jgi:uncharacterized protein YjbI with pentapeptide repeats
VTNVARFDWLRLIREENWDEFNAQAKGTPPQLANADLRMADLRRASLTRADLRGAYLRNADLRGLDLSEADLHGASLHEARISGVFFPANLAPEEIRLSVLLGTRMRTRAAGRVPS